MTGRLLEGKVIFVTGAGSGIGRICSRAMAVEGAQIVATDLNSEEAERTAAAIRSEGGDAVSRRCDVGEEADVAAAIDFAVGHYGRIDGAHNNAGIEMVNKPIHEISGAEWNRALHVDLTGVFYCTKYEFLAMKRQSGGGAIVNTASGSGLRGQINAADYVSAKHGVVGLTKSSAVDGAQWGIRVNSVCPGLIMTPMAKERLMNDPIFSQALDGIRKRHIIGRFGEPEEVADAVMWLLSDRSAFVTGHQLVVDGGYCI
ncbi:MAG: SDR family NAD(P)-dependent oxidoreductase [Sphingobium sp.]